MGQSYMPAQLFQKIQNAHLHKRDNENSSGGKQ